MLIHLAKVFAPGPCDPPGGTGWRESPCSLCPGREGVLLKRRQATKQIISACQEKIREKQRLRGSVNKLGGRRVVWEGFLEKVALEEGPKGKRGRERGGALQGGGEGQPAQTHQVEMLGVPETPRGRNWGLLLNSTQTSDKESETKSMFKPVSNGQEGWVLNGPERCVCRSKTAGTVLLSHATYTSPGSHPWASDGGSRQPCQDSVCPLCVKVQSQAEQMSI